VLHQMEVSFCHFAVTVRVSRFIKVRVSLKVWSVINIRVRVGMPVAECIYIQCVHEKTAPLSIMV